MAYRQQIINRWLSLDGKTRTQAIYTSANPAPSFGGADAITAAINAASHAGLVYSKLQPVLTVDAAAEGGSYQSILDCCSLTFRSAIGSTGRLNIPAPVDSLFLAGGDRIDQTNALVLAIASAMFTYGSDANGNAWVTLAHGKRTRMRLPSPFPG